MGVTTKQPPAAYVPPELSSVIRLTRVRRIRCRESAALQREKNGLDVLGKFGMDTAEQIYYMRLTTLDPNTTGGLANVISRSSADVLSRHSFLAAHLDLGSWPSQKLRTRRSRHSQVGCTIREFTGQSMLSLC